MDAGKWFRVLVLGGGALACGGPERSVESVTGAADRPVVVADAGEAPGAGSRSTDVDAGALAVDAGRRCVEGSASTVRFEDEAVGSCCIWGGELHPCCL